MSGSGGQERPGTRAGIGLAQFQGQPEGRPERVSRPIFGVTDIFFDVTRPRLGVAQPWRGVTLPRRGVTRSPGYMQESSGGITEWPRDVTRSPRGMKKWRRDMKKGRIAMPPRLRHATRAWSGDKESSGDV